MNTKVTVEELLRWRLARAEAEAPRAPRAARLLELARPWWETLPGKFHSLVERLSTIQIAYGHAMAEPSSGRGGYPVPAVLVRAGGESEASVRVLYLSVRDGRLRLRFQMENIPESLGPALEATFISDPVAQPLFSAPAVHSVGSEYRVDIELPAELAGKWEHLKVTNRMPFRLILRADQ